MKAGGAHSRPLLILGVLWMVAFSLACRLVPRQGRNAGAGGEDSALDRVLGVSRVAFGQSFYVGADDYFHRGVGRRHNEAFTNRLFQRWGAAIRPSGHIHTEGYSVSEILPWLRMATAADPGNVEAFLTMAYWLTRLNRFDTAEQVLREAQRLHPRDFRLLGARGQLAFRQRRKAQAAGLTDAALRVWPNPLTPDDEEARLGKARLFSIQRHLELLQSGRVEEAIPRDCLDHLFPVEHACDREDPELADEVRYKPPRPCVAGE